MTRINFTHRSYHTLSKCSEVQCSVQRPCVGTEYGVRGVRVRERVGARVK